MANIKKFRVLREHIGPDGRLLSIGSTREADPFDVKHLIPQTLAEIEEKAEAKADKPKENKGGNPAAENKAQPEG